MLQGNKIHDFFYRKECPFWVIVGCFCLVFCTYLYIFITPAFNRDDMLFTQENSYHLITIGRWAAYLVETIFKDGNPAPMTTLACVTFALVTTSLIAARILQIRTVAGLAIFILVSNISIFYGLLFSYDTVATADTLANLLAIYGLFLLLRKKIFFGVLFISIGPALYPVSWELAITILAAFSLTSMIRNKGYDAIWEFVQILAWVIISAVVYLAVNKIILYVTQISAVKQFDVNFFIIEDRLGEFIKLFRTYSLPIAPLAWRYPVGNLWIGYLAFAVFLCVFCYSMLRILRREGAIKAITLIPFYIGILIAPYCLILIHGDPGYKFEFRSLFSISTLHAFFLAFLWEENAESPPSKYAIFRSAAIGGTATVLILGSSMHINQWAFGNFRASLSEKEFIQKALGRVDNVLSDANDQRINNIPVMAVLAPLSPPPPLPSQRTKRVKFKPWRIDPWKLSFYDQRIIPITGYTITKRADNMMYNEWLRISNDEDKLFNSPDMIINGLVVLIDK